VIGVTGGAIALLHPWLHPPKKPQHEARALSESRAKYFAYKSRRLAEIVLSPIGHAHAQLLGNAVGDLAAEGNATVHARALPSYGSQVAVGWIVSDTTIFQLHGG